MSTWSTTPIHVLFGIIQFAIAKMRLATIIAKVRRTSTVEGSINT